jgi:alpha,alpha-trehalase
MHMRKSHLCTPLLALGLLAPASAQAPECASFSEIRHYIKQSWTTLQRSNATLLKSAADSKVNQSGRVTLYVPSGEDPAKITTQLRRELSPDASQRVTVLPLPQNPESIKEAGLLYLPRPYIVPGGRFNEMYGWDSYFILLGLLRDGELTLARDMTDNLLYEVKYYGKVLNANRTYYLNRSQPPFLTRMVLDVYSRTGDLSWLQQALPAIEDYYAFWMREPHLTPETGLSRYYGGSAAPAPEVVLGERDSRGLNEYDLVREYYRTHPVKEYDLARYYNKTADKLTGLFYVADGAMRESGFDPSDHYGPFSAGIVSYDTVDLNALLYRMEMDIAAIHTFLDQPREAEVWTARAVKRAAAINSLMWNAKAGLYFDYDFETKQQSEYRFITAFYPLWAGIASPEQAAQVAANLSIFERAGGLQTSDRVTGEQWDAPFGWAPNQITAIEGLRRYGFTEAADRLSVKFLTMVLRDFAAHGTIKEKYDVVSAKSDLAAGLKFGYASNEIGFGWTNAAFLVLYDELTPAARAKLIADCPK